MAPQMGYCTLSPADPAGQRLLASLASLLGQGPWGAWLEDEQRVDGFRIRDDVSPDETTALLTEWPEGRVFTDQADLRWERQSNGEVHLTVIADLPLPEGVEGTIELTPIDGPRFYLLWGTKRDGPWEEARIPHIDRNYPGDWRGPYAAIVVQTYAAPWLAPASGPTERFVTRYCHYDSAHTPTAVSAPNVIPLSERG